MSLAAPEEIALPTTFVGLTPIAQQDSRLAYLRDSTRHAATTAIPYSRFAMTDTRVPANTANLNALLGLITSSVQRIISIYNTAGHDVPGLDDVNPGPFDSPRHAPVELTTAIQVVEGACAQLCATIAPPGHSVFSKAHGFDMSACLRVAVGAKISDHLADKPEGLHTSELGELSSLNPDKLGRVLRLLATKHVYREVRPDVYANNRLSQKLLSSDPVSTLVVFNTNEANKTVAHTFDTLIDPEYKDSYSTEKTSFHKVFGTSFFDYTARHGFEEKFGVAMAGWSSITDEGLLPRIFPWSSLPSDSMICDLGGNNGHVCLDLLREHSHLKVVVQDQESVEPQWDVLWKKEYPAALEHSRAQFVPIDFFKEPPMKGCDVYYIRNILHDWPDDECVEILRHVKSAMKPLSRVLISEYVLQSTARSEEEFDAYQVAPEPLLPNFGEGRVRRYNMDINMLGLFNAKERTLQQFIGIGSRAGLEFVTLWESGDATLVEFKSII